jgi:hypothetical protein
MMTCCLRCAIDPGTLTAFARMPASAGGRCRAVAAQP